MHTFKLTSFLFFLTVGCSALAVAQSDQAQPRLVKTNGVSRLFVSGKPFLVLGGELGNSSASDLEYMHPIWPKLKAMHLNTVLAPVYWELMEPVEGKFDFKLVDSMLARPENRI